MLHCFFSELIYCRCIGRAVTRSSLEQKGKLKSWSGQIGLVLPAARHRHDMSSKETVLPGRNVTRIPAPITHDAIRRHVEKIMKIYLILSQYVEDVEVQFEKMHKNKDSS